LHLEFRALRSLEMNTITTKDGVEIFYKDWGKGQPIVSGHGWPLSADDWDAQMLFFLSKGFRVIAHDRRISRATSCWPRGDIRKVQRRRRTRMEVWALALSATWRAKKATWRRQWRVICESEVKIDTANHGKGSEEMLQSRSPSTDDQISTMLR
jgi:hypothetical protein